MINSDAWPWSPALRQASAERRHGAFSEHGFDVAIIACGLEGLAGPRRGRTSRWALSHTQRGRVSRR